MIKILVDPQIYNIQNYGGISRYYTEIFKQLSKRKDLKIILPIEYTNNEYLKESGLINNNGSLIKFLLKVLNKMGISTRKKIRKANEKIFKKQISEVDYDLFIPTYYDTYFLEYINNKPFVLTVYDMIHELYPQHFVNDPFNVVNNKKTLIHKATAIIAVSENTKKDILKIYPDINPSKIEVIHHGSSIEIYKKSKINLPNDYLLFVGSRDHYKNFRFLAETIANYLKENKNLYLVCAGGGSFSNEEIDFINKLGILNKIKYVNFNEKDLGYIYYKAKCFVFPSEYEGFGIPVLEAMRCKCPIVLTNNSSFPEVAGNAGIFFELNNKTDLLSKIKKVCEDDDFRKMHIEIGNEWVKKFNWSDASKHCFKIYKRSL